MVAHARSLGEIEAPVEIGVTSLSPLCLSTLARICLACALPVLVSSRRASAISCRPPVLSA